MILPQGKGAYVWMIKDLPPERWKEDAKRMGLRWCAVKIADGISKYNLRRQPDGTYVDDILQPFVDACREIGMTWVGGWQYIYGFDPVGEADRAIQRLKQFGLDGFLIDAEGEFDTIYRSAVTLDGREILPLAIETPDSPMDWNEHIAYTRQALLYETQSATTAAKATTYMNRLRAGVPDLAIGLSSYRWPDSHPYFPWAQFLLKCNFHAQQNYWNEFADAPMKETIKSYEQLKKRKDLPMTPMGRCFVNASGYPSTMKPGSMTQFFTTCKELGAIGAGFWSWDHLYPQMGPTANGGLERMEEIAAFDWEVEEPEPPEPPQPPEPPEPPGCELPKSIKATFVIRINGTDTTYTGELPMLTATGSQEKTPVTLDVHSAKHYLKKKPR